MENKEFYINHDGIKLHAKLEFPEKKQDKYPLVIVVHGFTGHMEEVHIRAIAKALNENNYATLRVELYGHGKSDGEFKNHTVLHWILELTAVIDYARSLEFVTDLYLTGHSQGGAAVVLTAALKSDALKAIMPLAPAMLLKDGATSGNFLGMQFDPEHIPDEVMLSDGRSLSGNYFRVNRFLPFEDAIKSFRKPVLIVHADADEAVPVHYARELAAAYENATLKIIPGDNHGFEKSIGVVTETMIEFLKGLS